MELMAESNNHGQTDLPRRFRALVVDDERDFRHLMTVFLQRSGMPIDVEAVNNGAEAVARLSNDTVDLILLDIMMPEMDGFEVCTRLRNDPRTRAIPILMLTALDEAADRTRGFLAGTDDYLAKPFDRGELLARVRRILQRTYGYGEPVPEPATLRAF
jgi:DNA-binding response OmpR family regulator